MKKIWDKSEVLFAVLFIIIYLTGNSLLDQASLGMGIEMVLTLPFDILLIAVMLVFIHKNNLNEYYGICAPKASMREMLYYLPLLLISTVNIWFGIVFNKPFSEGLVYFFAMIATGIVEEILFRGFLFRGMAKNNLRSAIILTSILFGIGHIVNLFNGKDVELLENICQIFHAISIGFLLVTVLLKGKSLIPCIITHSTFNALSAFANEPLHEKYQIPISVSLCILSLAAGFYYLKSWESEK
jgi:hypothetical protein